MKKVFLICLIFISTIFLAGCGDTKEALNSESFQEALKLKSFTIVDETYSVSDKEAIVAYYVATHPQDTYDLNFYVFKDESAALAFYASERDRFGGQGSYNELNVGNFSKYTQICNGKYGIVSRVGSTVLYANVDSLYRNEVNTLLKEIGY